MFAKKHDENTFFDKETKHYLLFYALVYTVFCIIAGLVCKLVLHYEFSLYNYFFSCMLVPGGMAFLIEICLVIDLIRYILQYIIFRKNREFYKSPDKIGIKLSEVVFIQIFVILFIIGAFDIGSTQIGSTFEKRNYEASYYVMIKDFDNSSSKYYKLESDIKRMEKEFPINLVYCIENLYFPSGHSIYFGDFYSDSNDDEIDKARLCVGKETIIENIDGHKYYAILTKEKIEKETD